MSIEMWWRGEEMWESGKINIDNQGVRGIFVITV